MPYDAKAELQKVQEYYKGDPLQKRFSALITGETNAGKTYLLRTARFPVHVDSFDPGGTKCLTDLIEKGLVVADTRWEDEDPYNPKVFNAWKKATELRLQIGYYDLFGTYAIDSATMWGAAIMNDVLGDRNAAGEVPQHRRDYNPQKVLMENYTRKLMRVKCDFFLMGHLREEKKVLSIDAKTGIVREEIKYRFFTTGQALLTIPLLFDEIYVIQGKEGRDGVKRELLIESCGTFLARSRLRRNGLLNITEEPDIKKLLKKCGFSTEDKPRLETLNV